MSTGDFTQRGDFCTDTRHDHESVQDAKSCAVHARLGRPHEWDEDSYCSLCGADGLS